MRVVFDPIINPALIALTGLVLATVTVWIYLTVGERLSAPRRWLLLVLRLAAVGALLVILMQPSRRLEEPRRQQTRQLAIALDTSRSMRQADVEGTTRLEAARAVVKASGYLPKAAAATGEVTLWQVDETARPLAAGDLMVVRADGETTRLHESIRGIVEQSGVGMLRGLLLLSDGRDFGAETVTRTAMLCRSYHVPVYAVPFGGAGRVRDLSVRLASYQPSVYRRQQFRIVAEVRVTGCEHEDIAVELCRDGERVESRPLNTALRREIPVVFEQMEEKTGRREYEVRVPALMHEVDAANNVATTYVSVLDQKLRVLLLEGQPAWDTTFLRRSLLANDRVELDAIVRYQEGKARSMSNYRGEEAVKIPNTREEFARYDVVILGRAVQELMIADRLHLLNEYVLDHGGSVIFARGNAFDGKGGDAEALRPVAWDADGVGSVTVAPGRGAGELTPFAFAGEGRDATPLPPVTAIRQAAERKPLTVELAAALDPATGTKAPGIVYRPYGRGRVLSVGLEGLWRWAFQTETDSDRALYDRFWGQLLLWLTVNSDFLPGENATFKVNSGHLELGEKAYFRLNFRQSDQAPATATLAMEGPDGSRFQLEMAPVDPELPGRLGAEFVPPQPGKYQARVTVPDDGARQLALAVSHDEPEEKDVAADPEYLSALCEGSGGRLLKPDEVAGLLDELREQEVNLQPRVKLVALWDRVWVAYGILALLAADWFLRRRWGLC